MSDGHARERSVHRLGKNGQIPLVLISPDGKLAVTRGPDHSLMVWDLATAKATHQWDLPEYVGGVAISADSRHLAVGLGNGPIYVLRLAEASMK